MDKSIKSILETLNNQIDSNELDAAIKADNFEGEYALSEDGITSILSQTKELLSINSAVNNREVVEKISKELYPKHMKSALSKVEENLKPVLDKLGVDYTNREFISDAIQDIVPKLAELSNGDNKDLVDSLNEDVRKSKELLITQSEQFEKDLKQRDDDILQDKIKAKFTSKATEQTWADAYSDPEIRDAILTQKWKKINAKAHLTLSESGEVIAMQKDFPEKELYLEGNNKPTTFQSLLEPEFEAYLKKSSPEKVNTSGVETPKQYSDKELKNMANHKRMADNAG